MFEYLKLFLSNPLPPSNKGISLSNFRMKKIILKILIQFNLSVHVCLYRDFK